jgi:hypothetical protein
MQPVNALVPRYTHGQYPHVQRARWDERDDRRKKLTQCYMHPIHLIRSAYPKLDSVPDAHPQHNDSAPEHIGDKTKPSWAQTLRKALYDNRFLNVKVSGLWPPVMHRLVSTNLESYKSRT